MGTQGAAIAAMRGALDLSQRQLAELAGVNSGYLSQVERDLVEPSERWLKSVTDTIGEQMAARA